MAEKEKVAVPEWDQLELLRLSEFGELAIKRHQKKQALVRLEAEIRELDDHLNPLLGAVGVGSVRVGNLTVKRVDSTSPSKLDKQLLLEHGVAADTIVACTVPGKPYSYVQTVEDKVK